MLMKAALLFVSTALLFSSVSSELVSVPAIEDVYTAEASPSASYQTTTLQVSDSDAGRLQSFVKFELPPILASQSVVTASLALNARAVGATELPYTVHVVDAQWEPSAVSWDQQPSMGLATGSPPSAITSADFYFAYADVTSYVANAISVGSATTVAMGLRAATGSSDLYGTNGYISVESTRTSHPPTLIVILTDPPPPTANATAPPPSLSATNISTVWASEYDYPTDPSTVPPTDQQTVTATDYYGAEEFDQHPDALLTGVAARLPGLINCPASDSYRSCLARGVSACSGTWSCGGLHISFEDRVVILWGWPSFDSEALLVPVTDPSGRWDSYVKRIRPTTPQTLSPSIFPTAQPTTEFLCHESESTWFYGEHLSTTHVSNGVSGCCDACSSADGCQGWTLDSNSTCTLLSSLDGSIPSANYTSGVITPRTRLETTSPTAVGTFSQTVAPTGVLSVSPTTAGYTWPPDVCDPPRARGLLQVTKSRIAALRAVVDVVGQTAPPSRRRRRRLLRRR